MTEEVCLGDQHAINFIDMFMSTIEIWDDLIDKDKPVSAEDINTVFTNLLFWLPQNLFFEKYKSYLLPIIMTTINTWHDSNYLGSEEDIRSKQEAWYLKQFGIEMFSAVAFLIGGFEHMRDVSLKIRKIVRHEDFAEYLKE